MTNDQFTQEVDDIVAQTRAGELPLAERMAAIVALTNEYIATNDSRPPAAQLDRLGNACLHEILTDSHPDKMTRDEFPLLSDRQAERRGWVEVPLEAAKYVAADGRDYRKPYAKHHDKDERVFIRNSALRKRVNDFKYGRSAGVVSVNIASGEVAVHDHEKCEKYFKLL